MNSTNALHRHYRLSKNGLWHRLRPGSASQTACGAEILKPDAFDEDREHIAWLDENTPGGVDALPICKTCATWAANRLLA